MSLHNVSQLPVMDGAACVGSVSESVLSVRGLEDTKVLERTLHPDPDPDADTDTDNDADGYTYAHAGTEPNTYTGAGDNGGFHWARSRDT